MTVALDSMAWLAFVAHYKRHAFPHISKDTRKHSRAVFADLWRLLFPANLSDVASRRGEFCAALQAAGLAPDTVRQKLSRVNQILRWAQREGIPVPPVNRQATAVAPIGPTCTPVATWSECRERYEREVLSFLSHNTYLDARTVFDDLERWGGEILAHPRDLTPQLISQYQARLRELGNSIATVNKKTRRIRSAVIWSARMGFIPIAPQIRQIRQPRGSKLMKGRAITEDEYGKMLAAVSDVVGRDRALSWRRFLRGLWTSGLRLGEAFDLRWDGDEGIRVDASGEHLILLIPGECQKNRTDQVVAMAPEFELFLLETPERHRQGYVFRLDMRRVVNGRPCLDKVSKTVREIGKAAAVIVGKGRGGKPRYASAHDFRRAFCVRLAKHAKPLDLKHVCRHADLKTTEAYYLGADAQRTAADLWEAYAAEKASAGSGEVSQPAAPGRVAGPRRLPAGRGRSSDDSTQQEDILRFKPRTSCG